MVLHKSFTIFLKFQYGTFICKFGNIGSLIVFLENKIKIMFHLVDEPIYTQRKCLEYQLQKLRKARA